MGTKEIKKKNKTLPTPTPKDTNPENHLTRGPTSTGLQEGKLSVLEGCGHRLQQPSGNTQLGHWPFVTSCPV